MMGQMTVRAQMVNGTKPIGRSLWSRLACALHLGLLVLILPVVTALPAPGSLLVVLPLGSLPADDLWLRNNGGTVLGPGLSADSLVVRGSWWRLVLPTLRQGALLVSASDAACDSVGENRP
jgi:hypothetical protein